jgi:hypothetical protein
VLKTIVVRPDGSKEFVDGIVKWCEENTRRYYQTIRRLARYEGFVARKPRGNDRQVQARKKMMESFR